jgi:hypothetical protein
MRSVAVGVITLVALFSSSAFLVAHRLSGLVYFESQGAPPSDEWFAGAAATVLAARGFLLPLVAAIALLAFFALQPQRPGRNPSSNNDELGGGAPT